ncbi:MAG TPA: TetR/AcrR family transcriptional regulator C-terminal domain-containing protein [Acidimicrobiales bacterium]|nr:TetR/AcrR family transcriptional regulator C-terminal domain-containing protein [Acidimicrobiales bacterium]
MPGVKSRPRPRGSTTTEDVIHAAVRIVDDEGVEALNIRRLASECGVSAMAIYRHVRDKDDLVDRVVDDVLARGLSETHLEGDWRTRIGTLMRTGRQLFLDHPGIADVCVRRPTPVAGVALFFDAMLTALRDAGLEEADRVRGFDALLMFLLGSVLWEVPRSDVERERLIATADQTPRAAQVRADRGSLSRRDASDYFDFGTHVILDGLVVRAGAPSKRRSGR